VKSESATGTGRAFLLGAVAVRCWAPAAPPVPGRCGVAGSHRSTYIAAFPSKPELRWIPTPGDSLGIDGPPATRWSADHRVVHPGAGCRVRMVVRGRCGVV